MTPDRIGIIAKEGDFIGLENGSILKIQENIVKIRTFITHHDGTRSFKDQNLYLGK